MELSTRAYQDFAAAIGERHVATDPSVLASYSWNTGLGNKPGANKLATVWPSAILMPGSTEEVQDVVRLCVRHEIPYRAFSTGQLTPTHRQGMVYVDLRRMDRLHSIDEKNQMAVIEPYVTVHRLQAEAMKKRLTCHIAGPGPGHSPLASAAAFAGVGLSGVSTGTNARNLLAFEWVTPAGELVRAGSAGAGVGWFNGEGPGPGFRGLFRGYIGTMGWLGIFTKIGYKLYPWAGPPALNVTGQHPQLRMPMPAHFDVYHAYWDTWEQAAVAAKKFTDSAVLSLMARIPPDSLGHILTRSNEEFVSGFHNDSLPESATAKTAKSWILQISGTSAAEARYKDRVIRAIVEGTGGRFAQLTQEHKEILLLNAVNSCYIHRVFRPAPGNVTSLGVMDTVGLLPRVMKEATALLTPENKPGGVFASTHNEGAWIWPTEGRHMWFENLPTYRGYELAPQASAIRYYLRVTDRAMKKLLGVNAFLVQVPLVDFYGSLIGNPAQWMRKIKHAFDPKGLSSAPGTFLAEPPPPAGAVKAWPIISRILFSRPFSPILKLVTKLMVKQPN